ncbi:hypothetical protein RFI_16250 [Reticulomyxa filosa]|uniref:Vps16 N-terminal domain-containing protein n=1 Tax=Reticulomyxa filosa TaxID=46433 RepID=X6N5E3_RETFI|nr:hypothetical protein RFI_16250 [Reticulomyxa filosa]|eukprot:ETO20954.1 hypothetical protein RFI_16250 [Reticulomyxa filosa]
MAAEWDEVKTHFFHKRKLYDCQWKDENGEILDLNDFRIAGASFGGPIAMIEDEKKVPRGEKGYRVRIYLPTGKLISWIQFHGRGLVKMGWSAEEHLVLVLQLSFELCEKAIKKKVGHIIIDASVIVYDMHGKRVNEFSMDTKGERFDIADCSIWGTGLVVRTAPTGDLGIRLLARFSLSERDYPVIALKNPSF